MSIYTDQVRRALLGLAVGDAFGAPFEYHKDAPALAQQSVDEKRYLDAVLDCGAKISRSRLPGLYTDDTQQALVLLLARHVGGDRPRNFILQTFRLMLRAKVEQDRYTRQFGSHRGTGGNFRQAVLSGRPVPTAGLGAAMRVGPVAVSFDDPQEMVNWVLDVSRGTTSDPLGLACAAKYAAVCWAIANPDRRKEVGKIDWPTDEIPPEVWTATTQAIRVMKLEGEEGLLEYAESLGWANKKMTCAANGFGLTGMAWAIHHALTAPSFREVLIRVCSSGGDTDTVAAMAGCLAALRMGPGGLNTWMIDGLADPEGIKSPEDWSPDNERVLTDLETAHRAEHVSRLQELRKKAKEEAPVEPEREQLDIFDLAAEAYAAEEQAKLEPVLFGQKTDPVDYAVFSNFAAAPFTLDGEEWPDTEHYYMAQKNPDDAEYQQAIREASTAFKAKKLGRKVELREGWDDMKYDIMFRAVRAKVEQNSEIAEVLLSTGDRPIHENRPDPWWGGGPNYPTGRDWLGQILMDVRDILRGGG